jgi:hypothetical protein
MYGVLLLAPLFAWLGYREAAKFARENGRPPWGLHPGFWALFAGLSLLIGGILLFIARRTTQPASAMPGPAHRAGSPLPAGPGWPTTVDSPPRNPWDLPTAPGAPGEQPVAGPPGAPAPAGPPQYTATRNILPGG